MQNKPIELTHVDLLQATSTSLKLVAAASGQLVNEWSAPPEHSINVTCANASQVLLATGGGNLVYLEVESGKLQEKKHVKLEYEISCLDISPLGGETSAANLAAVGMWTDMSVRVFSVPGMELLTNVGLGGEVIPRSVLFCAFEGVSWFLGLFLNVAWPRAVHQIEPADWYMHVCC